MIQPVESRVKFVGRKRHDAAFGAVFCLALLVAIILGSIMAGSSKSFDEIQNEYNECYAAHGQSSGGSISIRGDGLWRLVKRFPAVCVLAIGTCSWLLAALVLTPSFSVPSGDVRPVRRLDRSAAKVRQNDHVRNGTRSSVCPLAG
jgi:hypothetical protein